MAGGAAAQGPGGGQQQIASAVQNALGLPPRLKLLSPSQMVGMNQTDSRMWIDDRELFYIQNLFRLGNGRYRALWDVGLPLFTAPTRKTIISFFWFNIGFTYYCAVFYSDGTADQVDVHGNVTTISNTPNTFYHGSGTPYPACCQSGSLYLIIANNNTNNDYWLWDGSILYGAGGIGPSVTITDGGVGYTSPPTVTAYGGSGSGIVINAVVSGGSVIALNVVSPGTGYQPSDQVQLYFTGGGSDDGGELQAVIAGGGISAVDVTAPGHGYTSPPTVTFSSGTATAIAILGTGSQAGQVVAVQITDPGSGYSVTPTVSLTGGGGTGASASALLNAGAVTGVNVISGGTNLSGTPVLTIVGGGGTGAMAVANMSGGSIASVTVTNGGMGYTSVPAVVIQTGVNNAAAGTIELMPFGISGTAIEVFTGRVFVGPPHQTSTTPNGNTFFVSAPGSLTDFATSDGGLIFTSNDRFLRAAYTNFRQSNGYLYPMGDSSISVISNVQTSGGGGTGPVTVSTTFTYQNTDPQIGTQWRDTCQDFSRTILFANPLGVFGLYGGSVTKISQKIEQLFDNAIFPTTVYPTTGQPIFPSSAVANIHNRKAYCILMAITNPITNEPQNVILMWNEHDWVVATSEANLSYIGTREIASDLSAWGTDGKSIYQLFEQPSQTLPKIISSKLMGIETALITKQALAMYLQAVDISGEGLSFDLTVESEMGGWPVPPDSSFKNWSDYVASQAGVPPPNAPVPDAPLLAARGLDVIGQELGWTISTPPEGTSGDFEIITMQMATLEVGAVFG